MREYCYFYPRNWYGFDEGVISYLSSNQWKKQIKKINSMIMEIVDNPEEEKKYLV